MLAGAFFRLDSACTVGLNWLQRCGFMCFSLYVTQGDIVLSHKCHVPFWAPHRSLAETTHIWLKAAQCERPHSTARLHPAVMWRFQAELTELWIEKRENQMWSIFLYKWQIKKRKTSKYLISSNKRSSKPFIDSLLCLWRLKLWKWSQ